MGRVLHRHDSMGLMGGSQEGDRHTLSAKSAYARLGKL